MIGKIRYKTIYFSEHYMCLREKVLTCVEEGVRVSTHDNVQVRYLEGHALVHVVSTVAQQDDDVNALSAQLGSLFTHLLHLVEKLQVARACHLLRDKYVKLVR